MIGSIAELPFVERDAAELLGIVVGREAVDADFEGFGWGRFAALVLEDEGGARVAVHDALVLALHSAEASADADDGVEVGDLDLELRVGDEVLLVALSRFVAVWAERMPRATAWVLALCNPRGVALARPPAVPRGVTLWYGLGDVDAYAEHRPGEDDGYGLRARRWVRT